MEIMGILNVTPDSFSDGGEHMLNPVSDALQLLKDGATIIDIGGQSTRPGAELATSMQECERVLPVVRELALYRKNSEEKPFMISVDTMNAKIAEEAIKLGADIINDVSCATSLDVLDIVAKHPNIKYILMHSRGAGNLMQGEDYGVDVVETVCKGLLEGVSRAKMASIADSQIIIDPGLGFSKSTPELNWPLLSAHGMAKLQELGYPVLIAASRKRFIGAKVQQMGFDAADMQCRDLVTAGISLNSALNGAWGVRVHNVKATRLVLGTQLGGD